MFIADGCKEKLPEPTKTIHQAANDGDIGQVKSHIAKGADINAKDQLERAPLPWAVWWGHKEVVELLIAKGADINAETKEGETPMDWAKDEGNTEIVELLRKHGAME